VIERWISFWDRREAPHTLALVRILVGVALFADLIQAAVFDVVPLVWAPPPVGGGYGQVADPAPFVVRLFGASAGAGTLVWALAVVSCVLFTLGVCYRVTSWVLVFAMIELSACQPVGDSIDSLLRIVLPVLAASGAGAAWSFDAWLRRRRGKPVLETVPAWPRYLVVVQLLWIYVSAGYQRDAKSWGPRGGFAAIGNVLGDPHFARFEPGSFAALYPLTCFGTLLTMLFELSAPLYLLWLWLEVHPERGGRFGSAVRRAKIRWVWLVLGVSLHSGIALGMKIGLFPFGILALYPAFVRPSELLAALERQTKTERERLLAERDRFGE
jgi:hypothetical protein